MKLIQHSSLCTFKMILKQIGGLFMILGYAMAAPFFVSLVYSEYYSAVGFLFSGLFSYLIGFLFYKKIDVSTEPLRRHALIIAALGWLSIAIMGAVPFILIAYITPEVVAQQYVPDFAGESSSLFYFMNPMHALFESMSGFTTTGLTMAVHEPTLGKGLLFYRSLSQWIGGAGFIVLSLAVMSQSSGKIAFMLYGAESSGERLRPTIIETARSIWKIYVGLTLFSFVYLVVGTSLLLPDYALPDVLFDSLNHAMAGQSTGGFSTLDDSIASYHSKSMDFLYMLPMLLGALSLPLYYKAFQERKIKKFWEDLQTRSIVLTCIIGGILLSILLYNSEMITEPYRVGMFQFISALTTTGWQTSDVHAWDSASIVFIVMSAMIVGGSTGATVGGIKMIRVLLLFKGMIWHINRFFYSEKSIKIVTFNAKRLLPDEMNRELSSTAIFAIFYVLLVLLSTFLTFFFMGDGFSMTEALFESASAQGTVGLSSGITHPGMSPILELTYIIQMWAGRLEIIPVLILLRSFLMGTEPKIV